MRGNTASAKAAGNQALPAVLHTHKAPAQRIAMNGASQITAAPMGCSLVRVHLSSDASGDVVYKRVAALGTVADDGTATPLSPGTYEYVACDQGDYFAAIGPSGKFSVMPCADI